MENVQTSQQKSVQILYVEKDRSSEWSSKTSAHDVRT